MSAEYTLRSPKAEVTFHTVEAKPSSGLYAYEPQYGSRPKELLPDYAAIDVNTSKRLHNAAGAFRVSILPVIPGEQGGGVGRRAREAQMAWYDRLRPMDLVSIAIGREEEVMLGLVDQVTREEAVIGSRPRAVVTVTGRDFGKVWLVNRIKYIPAVASDPKDPGCARLLTNTIFGFRPQILAKGMSIKKVVNVIMEECRGLDLRLTNGKSVWDYVDYTTKVAIPEHFQLTAVNEAPVFSGSMYNYIKSITDSPFMEVWIESYKGKAYLVLRETPFTRERWENLDTWEGSFSEDTGHERRHTISDSEIMRESLSRSDSEAFSIFQVLFANMPMSEEQLYNVIPPHIDCRLLREYGLNHLEVRMQTLSFLDEGTENPQVLERAARYRDWLYEWYRHNPEFESGTIVIKGRPSIHVGDRIYHETLGKEFYVEQVSHSWSVGRPFTTTLGVTRGATDRLRWSEVERSTSWAYRREGSLV